jgi:cyclophilin family peptidyl-prolyl cis-trans isomerase
MPDAAMTTDQTLSRRSHPCAAFLARAGVALLTLVAPLAGATTVRMDTALGPVDIELFDTQAPRTVANFLAYVRRGAYDGMFFHRLMKGFVLQGGGFAIAPSLGSPIPTDPPLGNEFDPARSNLRATVAMAKLGGNPDSATSQWFVNLADNGAGPDGLDTQNGGFTVFGRVTAPGMAVVDRIAQLQVANAGGVFANLPIRQLPPDGLLRADDLVVVASARELEVGPGTPDHLRIFAHIEATYPQYATPPGAPVQHWEGYTYRHYAGTDAYLGVKDGQIWYLVPTLGPEIGWLCSVADCLAQAAAAGY